jgi:hypothetical protein
MSDYRLLGSSSFILEMGVEKNPLEFKCTSIILPTTFLLSPFPLSNKGIGMATVWTTSGVPSSFLAHLAIGHVSFCHG